MHISADPPAPLCPVEFTCDSGAYSSGVAPADLSAFGGWYWGVQKQKLKPAGKSLIKINMHFFAKIGD